MENKKENGIIDNQNCLCFVEPVQESIEKISAEFEKKSNALKIEKKLYLNRCFLISSYKTIEAMIVPEGVEEIFYIINAECSFMKKLYISSTVKDLKIWSKKTFYKNRKGLQVFISKENPYFTEKDGNIYTKDFSEIIYCNFENYKNPSIDERCKILGKNICVPFSKSEFFTKIKTVNKNSIFSLHRKIKLPEGIEELKSGFLKSKKIEKLVSVFIPSTVKKIGKNRASYFVSKKNEVFSSWKKCLYSKDYKEFLKGFTNSVRVKNGTENLNLEDSMFRNIFIPASVVNLKNIKNFNSNSFFNISKKNVFYSSWKGSVYSKDFSTLIYLDVQKNGDVYIHPMCSNFADGAFNFHRTYNIKPGKFFVPEKFQSEEKLNELKKAIFRTRSSYSPGETEDKDISALSVKNNIGEDLLFFNQFGPLDKEMIFSDKLVYIDKYYNPGQKEFIPIFSLPGNIELTKDRTFAKWNDFLIDCKIAGVIKMLNEKGYKTTACCSGHILKSEHYLKKSDDSKKIIACILERNNFNETTNGYISFTKDYSQVKRLFPPEFRHRFICKIQKLFKIKNRKESCFYIQKFRFFGRNKNTIILRFEYLADEIVQKKVMDYLLQKFSVLKNLA